MILLIQMHIKWKVNFAFVVINVKGVLLLILQLISFPFLSDRVYFCSVIKKAI